MDRPKGTLEEQSVEIWNLNESHHPMVEFNYFEIVIVFLLIIHVLRRNMTKISFCEIISNFHRTQTAHRIEIRVKKLLNM